MNWDRYWQYALPALASPLWVWAAASLSVEAIQKLKGLTYCSNCKEVDKRCGKVLNENRYLKKKLENLGHSYVNIPDDD